MRSLRSTDTLPAALHKILRMIGADLAAARRARRLTQEELAQRVCISRRIVGKMEKGDPSVSFRAYISAAWVMGLEENLAEMFSQEKDRTFQRNVRLGLPQRVRHRVPDNDELDF